MCHVDRVQVDRNCLTSSITEACIFYFFGLSWFTNISFLFPIIIIIIGKPISASCQRLICHSAAAVLFMVPANSTALSWIHIPLQLLLPHGHCEYRKINCFLGMFCRLIVWQENDVFSIFVWLSLENLDFFSSAFLVLLTQILVNRIFDMKF